MNWFRFVELTFLLLTTASNEVKILYSTDNGRKSYMKCFMQEGYSATVHKKVTVPLCTRSLQCHCAVEGYSATVYKKVTVPLCTRKLQCYCVQGAE
jgi:hypothetical protein